MADGEAGAGARAAEAVAALAGAPTPLRAFAAPDEGCRGGVPAAGGGLQPGDDLGDGGRVLAGEGGTEVHNPRYDFNDAAIPYGAGVLAAVAERELPPASGAPPAP